MSAAEKLKRVGQEAEYLGLANSILHDALPEIIAIVEAAERREDFAAPGVARLVAALDQALTVGGKE